MNIFAQAKALIETIYTAFIGLIIAFNPVPVVMPDVAPALQATHEIVAQEAVKQEAPEIVEAYELGRTVGRLEERVILEENKVVEATPVASSQIQPQPQPEPEIIQQKPNMQSITVISPIPGKGLGRAYTAQAEIIDESNYIEIGLIVRNENAEVIKDAQVVVTATDSTQNKTLNGTGSVTRIYPDGIATVVHYYPFHYEFHTVGQHSITFSVNGMTETVTIEVSAPTPA